MGRVFISYAHEDLEVAKKLYGDLKWLGADPWIDKEDLLPGQEWEREIGRTILESSHVLALISTHSVSKRGFVQKELRQALRVLEEIPPDQIFIVPCRIDNSQPTQGRLGALHWVDLFPSYSEGFLRIAQTLGLAGKNLKEEAALMVTEAEGYAKDGMHLAEQGDYVEAKEILQEALKLYAKLTHLAASDAKYIGLVDAERMKRVVSYIRDIKAYLDEPYRVS